MHAEAAGWVLAAAIVNSGNWVVGSDFMWPGLWYTLREQRGPWLSPEPWPQVWKGPRSCSRPWVGIRVRWEIRRMQIPGRGASTSRCLLGSWQLSQNSPRC